MLKNQDLLEYKLIMDVLEKSWLFPENELRKRFLLVNSAFQLRSVCMVIIEFDQGVYNGLSYTQSEYILAKTQELFTEWCGGNYVFVSAAQSVNRIAVILNADTDIYAGLKERLNDFVLFIQKTLPISSNIVVSELLENLQDIGRHYPSVSEALGYSYLYRYGNVFPHQAIRAFDENYLDVSESEYNRFESCVLNNSEDAGEWLKSMGERAYGGRCSVKSAHGFIKRVYGILLNIIQQKGILHSDDAQLEVLHQIKDAVSFDAALEYAGSALHTINAHLLESSEDKAYRLVVEIKEYIKSHCQDELSLTVISDVLDLNPSHISRLFKRVTGENISVYIVNAKLKFAASLLLSNPEMSITEIANKAGYITTAYFSRLFKEKYGVSPSGYRKSKI